MYDIRAPFVAVHATTGVETYIVEDPLDNSWPLAYHNLNTTNQRSFFNNLKHMEFNFFLRSDSNGAGYSIDRAACFFWHWQISYRGFGAGQILVDATADIQSRYRNNSFTQLTFRCLYAFSCRNLSHGVVVVSSYRLGRQRLSSQLVSS